MKCDIKRNKKLTNFIAKEMEQKKKMTSGKYAGCAEKSNVM